MTQHTQSFERYTPRYAAEERARAESHGYYCTCDACLEQWLRDGADPTTGLYGPFGTLQDITLMAKERRRR